MSGGAVPARCPSCSGRLSVERLRCNGCGTDVQGHFEPCAVCSLDPDSRRLFDLFLAARGNLKEVQRNLGLSYPTVRQRIEGMFQKLEAGPAAPEPSQVLAKVRSGELTVDQAERILRGDGK